MSSQKGNSNRTRPQKYKNKFAFKNDLHDKTKAIKLVNSIQVANVCDRCKSIIEWKIKYKKYKLLKSLKTCTKCNNKTIKDSYHTICYNCSTNLKVCCKCGTSDFTTPALSKDECKAEDGLSEDESILEI
uniref:Uncharacterized protein n=1 Tax=Clastoptera arizonana TaxID=38151 RepID=A0A1B6EGL7_9HEMI